MHSYSHKPSRYYTIVTTKRNNSIPHWTQLRPQEAPHFVSVPRWGSNPKRLDPDHRTCDRIYIDHRHKNLQASEDRGPIDLPIRVVRAVESSSGIEQQPSASDQVSTISYSSGILRLCFASSKQCKSAGWSYKAGICKGQTDFPSNPAGQACIRPEAM